jgi:predicted ATPase/DNA-binding XRE family transcriptional regulator
VSFGQQLRGLRRGLDLTQVELAQQAGCAVNTIRKLEVDERRPSRELAAQLAVVLHLERHERSEFVKLARGIHPAGRPGLPTPMTRLIGRESDIALLRQQLLDPGARLVTLVGAPGVGKTRLALQVAIELQDQFNDGAVFVPLASATSPELVMDTVAAALGVRGRASQTLEQAVRDFLSRRHVLLVLDNFEHVLQGAHGLAHLLADSARLTVLITSREALNVYGEHVYPVAPLGLPDRGGTRRAGVRTRSTRHADPRSPSEVLFLERATAIRPGFARHPSDRPLVADICTQLEGLPLAIELAAGRAGLMSVSLMHDELAQRLDLLGRGPTDYSPRQRSMRGAIDWSYSLLPEVERRLFCRLAVFAGGATLEAVLAIAGDLSEAEVFLHQAVESLTNKSLLVMSDAAKTIRFAMLDVIREYALEQLRLAEGLEQEQALRRRHAEYFSELAERGDTGLRGSDQAEWTRRLDADDENFRSALSWSLEVGDAALAGRLCCHLWSFWRRRGYYTEGRRWLGAGMALGASVTDACRACLLNGVGVLGILQGDYGPAATALESACDLYAVAGDKAGLAFASSNLGWLAHDTADAARAESLFDQSLRLRRELGDVAGEAAAFDNLGMIALERDDLGRACELYGRSAELYRPLGDSLGLGQSLSNLGWARQALGDYQEATTLFSESLQVAQRLEWPGGAANAVSNLALMAVYRGEYPEATDLFVDSLSTLRELGDRLLIAESLEGLGAVRGLQGKPVEAARLFGSAEALREAIGAPRLAANRAWVDPFVEAAREQVGETGWTQAWNEGRSLSLEAVLSELID